MEGNALIGALCSALDRIVSLQQIAFDKTNNSPAIPRQIEGAFVRYRRAGCFAVAGWLHEVENLKRDPGIVDHRISRAERMHCKQ
jgi:hypothetical protein